MGKIVVVIAEVVAVVVTAVVVVVITSVAIVVVIAAVLAVVVSGGLARVSACWGALWVPLNIRQYVKNVNMYNIRTL
jgi:hypothetical protein